MPGRCRRGEPLLKRLSLFAGFAAVALAGSLALAAVSQDAPAPPPPTDNEPAQVEVNIPDPEKVKRSAEWLVKMRQALKDVIAKLEEARNTKDVVKLNCVNEKLTQIKGLLRISELADVALQEAVAKKESDTATHEYSKVAIANARVTQLRAEAEECIGQLAFRTDENLSVEMTVPPDLPKGDPTTPPTPPRVDVRPAPASPT